PGVAIKPAQASSIWSCLISHLRSTVTVKRRLVHLRSHNDCFLGSEAVDVLAGHITNAKGFEGEALLHLFCLTMVGLVLLEEQPCSADMSVPARLLETSVKTCQLESRFTAKVTSECRVDSPSRELTDSALPQSLVNEVWQEQTLLRLLNLVELPLLEGVLQCNQNPTSPTPSNQVAHDNPDLIYNSNHLDRQVLKAFRDSQYLVVELSRELPQCCPPEKESCEREPPDSCAIQDGGKFFVQYDRRDRGCPHLSGLPQWKLLLYGTLVKHYSNTNRPPLLPQNMTDVVLLLLQIENKLAVKKSFSKAVLHSKTLPKEKEDLMLTCFFFLFQIPGSLHKVISEKLARLAQGMEPDVA
ncbi:hypothetical protein GOODEAATRI_025500, partial [Goodea atripinnis]